MRPLTRAAFALAQLRHLYGHLKSGQFNSASAIADALLSPQIAAIEGLLATRRLVEVPEGWKVVPIEPTKEMMYAFFLAGPYPEKPFTSGYQMMLDAAPEPGDRP